MIRIFLVDDHEIVRRGIADLVEYEPDLTVVGEAGSVAEAMARIPYAAVDVAVLDVRMPDGNGVELCRELRSRQPELNCLMLTSYADDEALFNAIMAGASGFVLKQVLGTDLVNTLRTVGAGGSLLDRRATVELLDRLRKQRELRGVSGTLTEPERAVFELVGAGLTNGQIGERLDLSERSVKHHVGHLLAKLSMARGTQAVVLSAQLQKQTDIPAD